VVDRGEYLHSLVWPVKNQHLISLINNTFDIQIDVEDGLPSGICNQCMEQLSRIDWIKRRSQQTNMLIKKFMNTKKDVIEIDKGNTDIKITETIEEATASDGKLQFTDDLFEEELNIVKIEEVFSLENSSESYSLDAMAVKQESPYDQEGRSFDEPITKRIKAIPNICKCKSCSTYFINRWSLTNHHRYCRKTFQCSECGKRFWNSRLFRMHKQKMHLCVGEEELRWCSECQMSFRRKWQLVFHVSRHVALQCPGCDQTALSLEYLRSHTCVLA